MSFYFGKSGQFEMAAKYIGVKKFKKVCIRVRKMLLEKSSVIKSFIKLKNKTLDMK